MDALEVLPGEAIGPIRIGMTRDEASDAADREGLNVRRTEVRARSGGDTLIAGDQLFAYVGDGGRVEEVEAAIGEGIPVKWQDMHLDAPARLVVAAFDAISRPDETLPEYPATTCYPSIGLCLWMDAKPRAPLNGAFESVLVRRPVASSIPEP